MSILSNFIKKWSILFRIIIFLIASAIALYLFPREGKFKYEFQKGEPWAYDLLIAPFNFPIYKTGKELQAERDTLLKDYAPYYIVDSSYFVKSQPQIENKFDIEWQKIRIKDTTRYDTLYFSALSGLMSLMDDVYQKGIISFAEQNRLTINGTENIRVVTKDFARKTPINDVLNPRTAYEYIVDAIARQKSSHPEIFAVTQNIDLNNFLQANIFLNKELSDKAKNELLVNISESSGLVQSGERIVDRGEIINADTYKILESYKKEYEQKVGAPDKILWLLAGQAVLIFLLLGSLLLFLNLYRKDIFNEAKSITFIYLNILAFVLMASLIHKLPYWTIYMLPFAIVPITLRTFFDSRTAIFVNTITVVLVSFFAASSFVFILLQITAGIAGAFSLKDLYKRDQLAKASGVIFLIYSIMYVSIHLIQEGDINTINPFYFALFGVNGVLLLFAYYIIYFEEKVFGYLSDVTLMELSDTNNELLRKLSERAPGTFQHTIMVSNLAQEAALRTNGNPLLARTGALYHDIGKIANPVLFTENQTGGVSPHDGMAYKESAKVIIDHVEGGIKLAQKYNLPEPIINFIRTHHGKSKAKYFYIKYKEEHPEEEVDGDIFTYPGPNPFSKEMAIMMMADAVEASSRSLKSFTAETINQHVDRIIDAQVNEGYFRVAPITFQDIEIVKECFKEKLKNIYHTRIQYPEEKKKDTNQSDADKT